MIVTEVSPYVRPVLFSEWQSPKPGEFVVWPDR
jgi:hypothetical protein